MTAAVISWSQSEKMTARAISDTGNNLYSSVSGEDYFEGSDSQGNSVDKTVCVYNGVLPAIW